MYSIYLLVFDLELSLRSWYLFFIKTVCRKVAHAENCVTTGEKSKHSNPHYPGFSKQISSSWPYACYTVHALFRFLSLLQKRRLFTRLSLPFPPLVHCRAQRASTSDKSKFNQGVLQAFPPIRFLSADSCKLRASCRDL